MDTLDKLQAVRSGRGDEVLRGGEWRQMFSDCIAVGPGGGGRDVHFGGNYPGSVVVVRRRSSKRSPRWLEGAQDVLGRGDMLEEG